MTIGAEEWSGLPNAVFNPSEIPVEELPVIFGFNNGGTPGAMVGTLLSEDGTYLGDHLCSSEYYMPHDLGVLEGSSPHRHETFREHYPDGYRMEFVSHADVDSHEKLIVAIALYNGKAE